ncbi:MAG TPA: hypothetical protein PKI11_00980 [Candidatus Hydrogenedentes bacterium]|nr:hypothetical protein [Candidatus Hydrogenedentota bacterium]HNT86849.1 hypothetical protein [Candidatus Hydrogenedentota bacterium]
MMKPKRCDAPTGRHDSAATRREQALCKAALESGDCDAMSDDEWVALCEAVAGAAGTDSSEGEYVQSGSGAKSAF